jgi:hypothetical protein
MRVSDNGGKSKPSCLVSDYRTVLTLGFMFVSGDFCLLWKFSSRFSFVSVFLNMNDAGFDQKPVLQP